MLGQLNSVTYSVLSQLDIPSDRYCRIRDALDEAGILVWGSGGGHPGISNPVVPESARIAWDVYAVIRRLMAFARQPTGGVGVHFDEPRRISIEPLIEASPTDESADPRPCRERMRDELAELLSADPDDFRAALDRVRKWKTHYESCVGTRGEDRE